MVRGTHALKYRQCNCTGSMVPCSQCKTPSAIERHGVGGKRRGGKRREGKAPVKNPSGKHAVTVANISLFSMQHAFRWLYGLQSVRVSVWQSMRRVRPLTT